MSLPRYPVYIVSKGRSATPLTARFLARDLVPFRIVVEPEEADAYARAVGAENVLELPFSNLGRGSTPARNWIWDHALSEGYDRHWILDDNIGQIGRLYYGERIPSAAGPALRTVEELAGRYENVALAGLNYQMFVTATSPAFATNVHIYSCFLIRNELPQRWRMRYNEDTDLCLQVLADGLATILINAFMIDKKTTMTMKGGNSDVLYQGDGRLRMARALEAQWPGLVSVDWRYGRPQHVIDWTRFKTPLKLRADVDLSVLPKVDELGLTLKVLEPIDDPRLQAIVDAYYAT